MLAVNYFRITFRKLKLFKLKHVSFLLPWSKSSYLKAFFIMQLKSALFIYKLFTLYDSTGISPHFLSHSRLGDGFRGKIENFSVFHSLRKASFFWSYVVTVLWYSCLAQLFVFFFFWRSFGSWNRKWRNMLLYAAFATLFDEATAVGWQRGKVNSDMKISHVWLTFEIWLMAVWLEIYK